MLANYETFMTITLTKRMISSSSVPAFKINWSYSMISDNFYSMLSGSLKSTGMVNLVRSLPIESLMTFHRLIFCLGFLRYGSSKRSSK